METTNNDNSIGRIKPNPLTLIKGDCLEVMKDIGDGSVDAIICDPPYG
jgi:predicted methyltransferase